MSDSPHLDRLATPADLRTIPLEDLPALAAEIRQELLDVVSANGGHLAPNLGVVELTIALVRVFDLERDRIIWDTGHQGYVYKLLTGRRDLIKSLRRDGGCCGFLHRGESPYDVFGAGHAGTAISAALGIAAARDRLGQNSRVLAVVGDGALGCGVSLEGLNNVIETTDDFIVVLNDNKMSIARNVGALARYLNRVISGEGYNRLKRRLRDLVHGIPVIGPPLRKLIHRVEEITKNLIVPGSVFEELGLRYIGPLDGHDLGQLVETFEAVRRLHQPLVVHVLTEKGRGYRRAEREPEDYHGLSRFDPESGQPVRTTARDEGPATTFSASLGRCLAERMAADSRVVAITAGMCKGTGLGVIKERFPERFFDVGIAEEHAVVFAAGLAAAGMRPVVAVYATFMQRAMDYVFHDVCLQGLPVVFCLDRAGVVDDGPTHHGIRDFAFWRSLPGLAIAQPADAWELCEMLALLLSDERPGIIRYPKAAADNLDVEDRAAVRKGKAEVLRQGRDVALWAVGREVTLALKVAEDLARVGVDATVVNARFVKPMDEELLRSHAGRMPIATLEDHVTRGGFASCVSDLLAQESGARLLPLGWPDQVIPWGTVPGIRKRFGLDQPRLVERIAAFVAP